MNMVRNAKRILLALALGSAFMLVPLRGTADDIDIYTGTSGGTAVAPRVILMIDNSQVGDANFPAKLTAIQNALKALAAQGKPILVGIALWVPATAAAPKKGAYLRFAPRDVTIPANLNAMLSIITPAGIPEGESQKDEPEQFYEIGNYFSGGVPYAGKPSLTNSTAPNLIPLADTPGNTNNTSAAQLGLPSGYAYSWDGTQWVYSSTVTPCSRNFIIYITTDNTFTPSNVQGTQCYNGTCAGPAITAANGAGVTYWGDEWAKYAYTSANQIITYAIDAAIGAAAGADATFTKVIQATALYGGGKYSGQLTTAAQFQATLLSYFNEILAVNSTFASANLPVNTTNRAQDKNQVFIPMFRPDPDGLPLWMGNLKQYQLVNSGTSVVLGDSLGQPAANPLTGFFTDCAVSFWTSTPSSSANTWYDYWQNVTEKPLPKGVCATSTRPWAEYPDGPIVEKGGVAEVVRNGNNPPTTSGNPTMAFNRTLYTATLASNALTTFDTTNATLTAALGGSATSIVNFVKGLDVNAEYAGRTASSTPTLTRPSLHGDVVHSRPLPIDYGGATGVRVYYGANDGTFRAVDASNGKELWGFVAPEHWSKLARLQANTPLIQYPGFPAGTGTAKDYFFDGSTGIYQNSDNSKVWIYPSMRRGGRMLYAFDVTNPSSPSIKWKVGCPNLGNDTNCQLANGSPGMTGIGQTWSTPTVAVTIRGYANPVVIVGGGYDSCEDANTSTPTCTTPKGAAVYVFDANTGALVKTFSTTRSVAADVALLAATTVGIVDRAYAVDTGGNVFRIDFGNPGDITTANWAINRVAYTNGSGRKFFYPPALLLGPGGKIYLALGSGDREHPLQSQYPYTAPITNRLYIYLDDLAATTANNLDDAANFNDVTSSDTCSTAQVLPTGNKKGWFLSLNQNGTGEQTVTSAVIVSGLVAFSTNRPTPAATGTCTTDLGEARGYFVNLLNGSGAVGVTGTCGGVRSAMFVGGGLPPSPVLATVPVGGVVTTVLIGAIQRSGGASSSIGAQKIDPTINKNRKTIYWKSSGEK